MWNRSNTDFKRSHSLGWGKLHLPVRNLSSLVSKMQDSQGINNRPCSLSTKNELGSNFSLKLQKAVPLPYAASPLREISHQLPSARCAVDPALQWSLLDISEESKPLNVRENGFCQEFWDSETFRTSYSKSENSETTIIIDFTSIAFAGTFCSLYSICTPLYLQDIIACLFKAVH